MSTRLRDAWNGRLRGGALTIADDAIPKSEGERSRILRELEAIRESNRQRALARARQRAERDQAK